MKVIKNKSLFYILSFTWGLPMTLVGILTYIILSIFKYKPEKFCYTRYFKIGKWWGGVSLGFCFLTDELDDLSICQHEFGHMIQNCYFGPFMLFLVCIPSALRYWKFTLYEKIHKKPINEDYDDVWFENQATRLGTELYEYINKL